MNFAIIEWRATCLVFFAEESIAPTVVPFEILDASTGACATNAFSTNSEMTSPCTFNALLDTPMAATRCSTLGQPLSQSSSNPIDFMG